MTASKDNEPGQRYGRTLITRLALCLKLATFHDLKNAAMKQPVRDLVDAVREGLVDRTELVVQRGDDTFFLDGQAVPVDFTTAETYQKLRLIMQRLGAREIAFTRPALTEEECRYFLERFRAHHQGQTPTAILTDSIPRVRIGAMDDASAAALSEVDPREALARAYARLTIAIERSMERLGRGEPPRLVHVRKAIQALADVSRGQESLLVAMTRFDGLSGALDQHLTTVTALTLLVGRRLGLSQRPLSALCLAAALHDVARMEVPATPLGEGHTELQAWIEEQRRVPLRSLLLLSRGSKSDEILGAACVAYEHGLYLSENDDLGSSAAARIVSVACAWDLAVAPPVPRPALSPRRVTRMLAERTGDRFDSRVVKLLTSIVGIYPVGSLLRLSGGETAIVIEPPTDPRASTTPVVRVLGHGQDYVLDLSAPDVDSEIVEVLDAPRHGVNTLGYLLA